MLITTFKNDAGVNIDLVEQYGLIVQKNPKLSVRDSSLKWAQK